LRRVLKYSRPLSQAALAPRWWLQVPTRLVAVGEDCRDTRSEGQFVG